MTLAVLESAQHQPGAWSPKPSAQELGGWTLSVREGSREGGRLWRHCIRLDDIETIRST